MLDRTLKSLGGASAIAQTVAQDLPTYPTQAYIRGLLFLFFGITFQMNHQLNPDIDNVNAYNFIAGMIREEMISIFMRFVADQYTLRHLRPG